MAGRPVTIHGGQSSLLYGMITFVGLFVLMLALTIILLTKNKAAEQRALAAATERDRYGPAPAVYEDEARSRQTTVFAVVSDDLRKLAGAVSGMPEDTGHAIQNKIKRMVGELTEQHQGVVNEGDTLLTALASVSDALGKARDTVEANTVVITDLQAEKDSLAAQVKTAREEFEGQVAALSEQLKRAQDEKAETLAQKDAQLTEVQERLDAREQQVQKLQREGTQRERDLQLLISQLERQIADNQKQLATLRQTSFDPTKILTSADGKIVRAMPGSDVVYINLGAADNVKPGMGFEVFSRTAEAPSTLRGKASLEIVTVMEETSECRLTRREAGHPIVENDIIVNLAYDRARKPKFVIRGDFDLNYDGVMDYNGVLEISSLIRLWGGQVVDDLDATVDFLVVGQTPRGPALDEQATEVVRAQAGAKEIEAGRFGAVRSQAEKMGIPILTQNQFLFLTGYAGDAQIASR
ncbi:MAG: hypothetical protein AB1716_03250 [Planctomycetota bacterium]